jgi:hypothetical protein
MHVPIIECSNTSKIVRTEINRYKDNSFYLTPTTKKLHDSLEKASINTQPLYTSKSLRETRENIIHSIDHILNHDLVGEDPLAAKFDSVMEREMQDIKEQFNGLICSSKVFDASTKKPLIAPEICLSFL